jgi:hypothetical protein
VLQSRGQTQTHHHHPPLLLPPRLLLLPPLGESSAVGCACCCSAKHRVTWANLPSQLLQLPTLTSGCHRRRAADRSRRHTKEHLHPQVRPGETATLLLAGAALQLS